MEALEKAVFFVSAIRPLDAGASSTDLMTSNLLAGLRECGKRIVFFAISEIAEESEHIREYYAPYCDQVILLPSAFGYGKGKYTWLCCMIRHSLSVTFYRRALEQGSEPVRFYPEQILSHSPSAESTFYSRVLLERYPETPYTQYWSDPVALSGITPEAINLKRLPHRLLEHWMLSRADRIVYGTKTLMQIQQDLYRDLASRMRDVDIAYAEKSYPAAAQKKNSLLYAGMFDPKYRNIAPLVEAVSGMPEYTLDVYGDGNCPTRGAANVTFHGRVPPDELAAIEGSYETKICLLNHSCVQIPGKIFYDLMSPSRILVIADGKYSGAIQEYLSTYRRFAFCDNEPASIAAAIRRAQDQIISSDYLQAHFSPRAVAESLLAGGKDA